MGDGANTMPLFRAADATGADLGPTGCWQGSVFGSYLHLIDHES